MLQFGKGKYDYLVLLALPMATGRGSVVQAQTGGRQVGGSILGLSRSLRGQPIVSKAKGPRGV